jgi:hypothetical protein
VKPTEFFVSERPLQSTMRELQRLVTAPRFWAAIGGASLLLGLIGPFGTYDGLRLPARLAYWAAMAVSTYLVGYGGVMFLARLRDGDTMPGPASFAAYGAVAGLPVTLVVWALNRAAFEGGDAIPLLPLAAYVVAISAVVSALVALFSREFGRARASAARPVDGPRRPRILDRLPAPQRGRLSHMSMQDHYVEIRTDRGGGLVLMRFADAIAEAEGVDGVRIHRSHWVARDMVDETVRPNGKPMVRMKDGTLLPVSRGFLDAARAAGLA